MRSRGTALARRWHGTCARPGPRLSKASAVVTERGHIFSEDCSKQAPMSGASAVSEQDTARSDTMDRAAVSERIKTVVSGCTCLDDLTFSQLKTAVVQGCTDSDKQKCADLMEQHKASFKKEAKECIKEREAQEACPETIQISATPPSSPQPSAYKHVTPSRGTKPCQAMRTLQEMQDSTSYMHSMGGSVPLDLPTDYAKILYASRHAALSFCMPLHAKDPCHMHFTECEFVQP